MWQSIQPVNIFKGNKFKLPNDNHLTFTALEEPSVVSTGKGDRVRIKSRVSGKGNTKMISVPYDSLVSIWNVAR